MSKRGRPTVYTDDLAGEILGRLAEGETLRAICRDEHMPAASTVIRWANEDREGFSERYIRARGLCLEAWADEIVEIADTDKDPSRARVRVDTRKWLMSRLKPDRYGDRQTITHEGDLPAIRVTLDDSDE